MRFSLFDRHPHEELSSYLDKELLPLRVEFVKTHLSSCPTCRAELDALRNLKSQLAALPEAQPSRSFALTPAMAQRPAREAARVRPPARVAVLTNGMRLAGAGMAAAFAVVMVLNFSGSGSDGTRENDSQALIIGSSIEYSTSTESSEDSALDIPGAAATSAAQSLDTDIPPADGVSSGSVGGAPTAPDAVTGLEGADASPQASGGAPEGGDLPATDPEDKSPDSEAARAFTPADDNVNDAEGDQAVPEASALSESDGNGIDILLLVAIVLGAGVVLAFAGSVIIPRIARDEQ
jgi:hypothetical protein